MTSLASCSRLRFRLAGGAAVALLAVGLAPSTAGAEPTGPGLLCETYPQAPACAVAPPACSFCHTSTDPDDPSWNAYGDAVRNALDDAPFEDVVDALLLIEDDDSDRDGFTNSEELEAGTLPGDAQSIPAVASCPEEGHEALLYRVCEYDAQFAFRKLNLDFCGAQPSFEAYEAFGALSSDAQAEALDEALSNCLASEFWRGRDGVLWQLAYAKVRPVHALKAGGDPSPIESLRIADYDHDMMLFAYTQVDDNDARDVLLADYYVQQDGTEFTVVPEIGQHSLLDCTVDDECPGDEICYENACHCAGTCGQSVVPERRQGLLTTRWVALYSTMFSAMPRNTAAQAYRSFLGFDIAKQEGLFPVGEPADYDNKGVDAEACAFCHSTLDPLTYPFSTYSGFGPFRAQYYADRMSHPFFAHEGPEIGDTPEAGAIFGQPVADLGEWAEVAAQSDAFAKATVNDYWNLLLGRAPEGTEAEEFTALWQDFRSTHSYGVESMLHDLIKTEAYGAP